MRPDPAPTLSLTRACRVPCLKPDVNRDWPLAGADARDLLKRVDWSGRGSPQKLQFLAPNPLKNVLLFQNCGGPDRELSNRLRHHLDRAARAFGGAEAAALAIVVVELEPFAGAELDHGVVGADAVAIVAFEAIAARETTARLIERVGLVEA